MNRKRPINGKKNKHIYIKKIWIQEENLQAKVYVYRKGWEKFSRSTYLDKEYKIK